MVGPKLFHGNQSLKCQRGAPDLVSHFWIAHSHLGSSGRTLVSLLGQAIIYSSSPTAARISRRVRRFFKPCPSLYPYCLFPASASARTNVAAESTYNEPRSAASARAWSRTPAE